MKRDFLRLVLLNIPCVVVLVIATALPASETVSPPNPEAAPQVLTLAHATMCEDIESYEPRTPAVTFSIAIGRVACFTLFDPVPRNTVIYHRWYHRDDPSTTKKLNLRKPRWATYSSIQLRETDKGPWRVDITDADGHILSTLRFSITD